MSAAFNSERPTGRLAIGWRVETQSSPNDQWDQGIVIDTKGDWLLVEYEQGRVVWEPPTFKNGPWHMSGKPRVRFLSSPCNLEISHNPKTRNACHHPLPALNKESWLCEHRTDRTSAPTTFYQFIDHHDDEVLSVSFSNDGSMLASCSRDGTTRIYKISTNSKIYFETVHIIQHATDDVPCRVVWSPDDIYILICTEAKSGNIWDRDASVGLYSVSTGIRHFSKSNVPFDVCAEWLPCGSKFFSGENLSLSPRGSFHQVLALWDIEGRLVGRLAFRFSGESFIHLIRVSPCGGWLSVTTGVGDVLSDAIRVLKIPNDSISRNRTGSETSLDQSLEELEVSRFDRFSSPSIESSPWTVRIPRNRFFTDLSGETLPRRRVKRLALSGPIGDGGSESWSSFCGGAVLGMEWSKKFPGRIFANVRKYQIPSNCVGKISQEAFVGASERPELANTVELQLWELGNKFPTICIPGAQGFTTKECPFYLFLAESPCGEYVASGSEDCGVYLYSLRHSRVLRALTNAHNDVVSSVSWMAQFEYPYQSVLASASDDHRIGVWVGYSSIIHSDDNQPSPKRQRTF